MDAVQEVLETTSQTPEAEEHARVLKGSTPREEELSSRPKSKERLWGGGVNKIVFVELQGDGEAVFKPVDGEVGTTDRRVPVGSFYRRERAAYLVNRFLNLGIVPPTVIREMDGKVGSLQEFISDGRTVTEEVFPAREHRDLLYSMWVFDYVIWNSDRNWSNVLLKGDRVWAIDNGFAFCEDGFCPYRSYYDTPAPLGLRESLEGILKDKFRQDVLRELLAELLSRQEVKACMARIEFIGKLLTQKGRISREVQFEFFPAE